MNFLELLKNTAVQRLLLFSALIICILLWMQSCNSYRNDLDIANNNFDAYRDTTKTILLKNGQLEYERQLYMATGEELKKYSEELKRELDKERKNVKILIKTKIIVHDSIIYVDSSKYKRMDDSTYKIFWEFNYQTASYSRLIKGDSKFSLSYNKDLKNVVSNLTDFELSLDVVSGIREISPNRYVTFVRTKDSTSKIYFKDIEGAIVDPSLFKMNDDKFAFGPQLSFGYTGRFEFFVGVGLTYKLFGF